MPELPEVEAVRRRLEPVMARERFVRVRVNRPDLRTPFRTGGRVTAGNSAGLTDGATACFLAAEETAAELGLEPKMRLVAFAFAGVEPELMGIGPIPATKRVLEQTGVAPRRPTIFDQLIDLGFPFTLYEQGPFVAHGIPALTLTTAGERPPDAFTDRAGRLSDARLTGMGRAAQQVIGSLDQGLELAQGTTSFVWAGDRIVRGWAIELVLFTLLVPFLVGVVDLFAHCRRRGIALMPALRSLRTRLSFWLFAGLAFYAFKVLGAWPTGTPRPPSPSTNVAGDWPVLALIALGVVVLAGWFVSRQRLVPHRAVGADERLAGETASLLALGVVALLVLATNPFALLFILPALHAWLWLPQVRSGRPPARAFVLLLGLTGPALIMLSLGVRYGLGFDAPWYLLELVAIGYVHLPAVAITLGGAACAAQLVAITAGRYAPYPEPTERPVRGPLRALIRSMIIAIRARRRVTEERRRTFGG